MSSRDQLLSRLHDGELSASEADALRAQLGDEDQQKLQALSDLDALLTGTLVSEANAADLDLWAGIEAKLPKETSGGGKLLPLLRRRSVRFTAVISALAAAAALVMLLRPVPHSKNHCEIEELDVAGENATVMSVHDAQGHETALIWVDHQETDEWQSL